MLPLEANWFSRPNNFKRYMMAMLSDFISVYPLSRIASQKASSDEKNYLSACDLCQQFQYQSSPSLMESHQSNSISCSINFFFSTIILPYSGTRNNFELNFKGCLVWKVRRYLDWIEDCNAFTIGSGTRRLRILQSVLFKLQK